MKLDKFTKILLNVVFILLIALLVKSLATVPKDLYAKDNVEYEVEAFDVSISELGKGLNEMAKKGWRLHSAQAFHYMPDREDFFVVIYER